MSFAACPDVGLLKGLRVILVSAQRLGSRVRDSKLILAGVAAASSAACLAL